MGPRRHGPMARRRFRHGFVRTLRPSHGWSQAPRGPKALAGSLPVAASAIGMNSAAWASGARAASGIFRGLALQVPTLRAGRAPRLQAGAREPRPDLKLPAKAPAGNASGRPAGVPAPGQCDFIGPPRLLAATGEGLQAGATAPRIAMWPIGIVDVGHRISVGCMRLHIASRDYSVMQRQLGERTVTMPLRTEAFEYDSSS